MCMGRACSGAVVTCLCHCLLWYQYTSMCVAYCSLQRHREGGSCVYPFKGSTCRRALSVSVRGLDEVARDGPVEALQQALMEPGLASVCTAEQQQEDTRGKVSGGLGALLVQLSVTRPVT